MLQVKEASRKTFWPALCAVLASAALTYALVAWVLQIQSLRQAASVVPVVLPESNLPVRATNGSHVAVALGAPLPSLANQQGSDKSSITARQWNLLGVVAGVSGQGSALIGVDGQAPKAFLPGQTVAPGWILHSVGHRLARLAHSLQDSPTVILELPQ
jgi:general secretion pathway protein C